MVEKKHYMQPQNRYDATSIRKLSFLMARNHGMHLRRLSFIHSVNFQWRYSKMRFNMLWYFINSRFSNNIFIKGVYVLCVSYANDGSSSTFTLHLLAQHICYIQNAYRDSNANKYKHIVCRVCRVYTICVEPSLLYMLWLYTSCFVFLSFESNVRSFVVVVVVCVFLLFHLHFLCASPYSQSSECMR